MKNSKIEWCDHTFNPWIGCTKVSPGCDHCYAERLARRWHGGGQGWGPKWGPGEGRRRTSDGCWRHPLAWDRAAAKNGIRQRVFCGSMCDWLDNEIPVNYLADLMALIDGTRHLRWLLLTKRPQEFFQRLERAADHHFDHGDRNVCGRLYDWFRHGVAFDNVWIGITAENQEQADIRIPQLLQIPARVRFLSCEPLLGPVNLRAGIGFLKTQDLAKALNIPLIDWVICGGESGPAARPMHPDWARGLRDQCQAAGVPFFFKQWGEWIPLGTPLAASARVDTFFYFGGVDGSGAAKVGKKAAGRMIDGCEWNELPEVKA